MWGIAATVVLFRSVPTGFIPDEDQGYVIISVQGPEGMSFAQNEKVLRDIVAEAYAATYQLELSDASAA